MRTVDRNDRNDRNDKSDKSDRSIWMVPLPRNLRFVGRERELKHLSRRLREPSSTGRTVITGLGGVGKSQIALELAFRFRESYSQCSVFWVTAADVESLDQAYVNIARELGLGNLEPKPAKTGVKNYLDKTKNLWLLIVDNADEKKMWTRNKNDSQIDFIPQSSFGRVLFTTRNREIAVDLAISEITEVAELDEETGLCILEKSLLRKDVLRDRKVAVSLLKRLTFLPLAISQAVSYINKKGIKLETYIELLGDDENVIKLLKEDFEDEHRRFIDSTSQNAVFKTWSISFNRVKAENKLAVKILEYMACLNPENIPLSLLPLNKSKKEITDAIGLLSAYSFIETHTDHNVYSIHRLVHLVVRDELKRKDLSLFNKRNHKLLVQLNDKLARKPLFQSRTEWGSYIPHAFCLSKERYDQHDSMDEAQIKLMTKVAYLLSKDEGLVKQAPSESKAPEGKEKQGQGQRQKQKQTCSSPAREARKKPQYQPIRKGKRS